MREKGCVAVIEKIGLQLFSVRDFMQNDEDVYDSLIRIKKMGYEQVQTYRFPMLYGKFAELAEEVGLEIIGVHDFIDNIENEYDE